MKNVMPTPEKQASKIHAQQAEEQLGRQYMVK
jgi:hypothetical protein